MIYDPVKVVLIADSEPIIAAVRISLPAPNQLIVFPLKDALSGDPETHVKDSAIVQISSKADVVFVHYALEQSPLIGTLCFHLRKSGNVPVIAITGGGQAEMISALLSGADDVTTLPLFLPFVQAKIGAFQRLMKSVRKLSSSRIKKKLQRQQHSLLATTETIVEAHIGTLESALASSATGKIESVEKAISGFLETAVNDVATTLSQAVEEELSDASPFSQIAKSSDEDRLDVGGLSIDFDSHRFFVDGNEIELTPKEFGLLAFLMARPGTACSRDEILDGVWGINFETGTNMVDVYMHFVRRKLEAVGKKKVIQTVRGFGYRLVPDTA